MPPGQRRMVRQSLRQVNVSVWPSEIVVSDQLFYRDDSPVDCPRNNPAKNTPDMASRMEAVFQIVFSFALVNSAADVGVSALRVFVAGSPGSALGSGCRTNCGT